MTLTKVHIFATAIALAILLLGVTYASLNLVKPDPPAYCGGVVGISTESKYEYYEEHPGFSIFNNNCTSCHDMHRTVIAPPLKDIFYRRDPAWIRAAIINLEAIKSGSDNYVITTENKYSNIPHPAHNFSHEKLDTLMDYIKLFSPVTEEKGEHIFQENCSVCHAVHRITVGPALKYVYKNRDSIWVNNAILNFNAMVQEGDPTAVRIYEQFGRIQHPTHRFNKLELSCIKKYLESMERPQASD